MLLVTLISASLLSKAHPPAAIQKTIVANVRYVHAVVVPRPSRRVTPHTTYAGTVSTYSTFEGAYSDISFDPADGSILFTQNNTVGRIKSPTRHLIIDTLPGGLDPGGVVYDPNDQNIYVTIPAAFSVYRIQSGSATLVAGGTQGSSDGQGSAAQFEMPTGITFDADDGDLYVADQKSVRRVTTSGAVTTVSPIGNGTVQCCNFQGIAFDPSDHNLYVADELNDVIEQVSPIVDQTLWLTGSPICYYQHDGPAPHACFDSPTRIVYVAGTNSLYISDFGNNIIRQIDPAFLTSTLAGSRCSLFSSRKPCAGVYFRAHWRKPSLPDIG